MMKRSLVAVALVLGLALSGCSAFRVSSSDEAGSKPANVGIGDGQFLRRQNRSDGS